jgi:iron(III) transport system ATP-binding protein
MLNAPTRLKLEGVSKEFQQRGGQSIFRAVDDVTLHIGVGEFVTLLGPSGCGKTTTLRMIAGFETPTSGSILLDGEDVTRQPPNKRDMALVFQNYALFPHMTVFANVAYGLETRGLNRKDLRKKVEDALALMSLHGLGERRPNQLSGGQQQRVALARSLVMEPRILLFDEPLSNLDAKLRVQMRSEIHSLQRRLNITSIYVTHDQTEAMALSDRVIVMNKGKIEQIGSPRDIYRTPKTRFVADFIGRANFVEATLDEVEAGRASIRLFETTLHLPLHYEAQRGDKTIAMLRPEALLLRDDPSLPQVRIEQAMYLGSEIEYLIVTEDGQTLTVVDNDPRKGDLFSEGQTVGLDFLREVVHLLPV